MSLEKEMYILPPRLLSWLSTHTHTHHCAFHTAQLPHAICFRCCLTQCAHPFLEGPRRCRMVVPPPRARTTGRSSNTQPSSVAKDGIVTFKIHSTIQGAYTHSGHLRDGRPR